MSSIIQKRRFLPSKSNQSKLPLSQTDSKQESLLRRRLSLNINIPHISSFPASSSWAFRRSKSLSSMGHYAGSSVRKWWDWGWNWVLSRKPTFAKDLEQQTSSSLSLGFNDKGSWRHVFYKLRSELRKLAASPHTNNVGLPQTYRYDSFNYSKNFDDGRYTSSQY